MKIEELRVEHSCDVPNCQIWEFWPPGPKNIRIGLCGKVGQLVLFPWKLDGWSVWMASNMWLWDTVRGRGLMRQLIRALLPRYKAICSDYGGQTSEFAVRMFEALGCEKIPCKRCPKGFVYLLRQNEIENYSRSSLEANTARHLDTHCGSVETIHPLDHKRK